MEDFPPQSTLLDRDWTPNERNLPIVCEATCRETYQDRGRSTGPYGCLILANAFERTMVSKIKVVL